MKKVSGNKSLGALRVRLLESAGRLPTTPIEQWAVDFLSRGGPALFSELVRRIAGQLYHDEVRRGAAVLDIGLFGPELFHSEVTSELKAGDGILWKIERPEAGEKGQLPGLS